MGSIYFISPVAYGMNLLFMVVAALDSPCHKQSDGHHVGKNAVNNVI